MPPEQAAALEKLLDVPVRSTEDQVATHGPRVIVPHSFYRPQPRRVTGLGTSDPDPVAGASSSQETSGDGPRTLHWAYGVTTVPARFDQANKDSLLFRTLASLERAGFPAPRLFIDGGSPYGAQDLKQRTHDLKITQRDKLTAYGSWYLALLELYLREPTADRYALFQDDIVAVRNLRDYLDACPYPATPPQGAGPGAITPGYWNLYTAPSNLLKCPNNGNFTGWYESNQCGKGALGLVFTREAVQLLLASPHMVKRAVPHPTALPDTKAGKNHTRSIDGGVVTSFQLAGWMEYVHSPSLLQHTGGKGRSTLGEDHHDLPDSYTFPGEGFDAIQLLPNPPTRPA